MKGLTGVDLGMRLGAAALLVAVSGCEGLKRRTVDPIARLAAISTTEAAADDEAPSIDSLPEDGLPDGECGLLLWTVEDQKPVLIFREVVGETAGMMLDGAPATLSLRSASGDSRYGVSSTQEFTSGQISISVTIDFGRNFDGGAYVEHGRISVHGPNGWERAAPVAGLVGCRGG